jgi:hypothetical protein
MLLRKLTRGLLLAGWAAGWIAAPASAHVVVDAAFSEQMLREVQSLSASAATGPAEQRAAALVDLGQTLARAIDLLNQDLAAHDGQLGIFSQALTRQLRIRGMPPVYSAALKRYLAPVEPFEQALALAPEGARAGDARFHLLTAHFYDSFAVDPMQPLDPDWRQLNQRIVEAEAFLAAYPDHPGRIETEFILAIEHARAARLAPEAARARHARAAEELLHDFEDRDPYGTRTVTLRQVIEALPADGESRS